MAPVTLDDSTNINLKEEIKEMLGEMKIEIMTKVDAAIKSQLSSVIKEMKCQRKDMFKEMIKEMIKEMTTTTKESEYEKQLKEKMTTSHTKKNKKTNKWTYYHPTKTPTYRQIKTQQKILEAAKQLIRKRLLRKEKRLRLDEAKDPNDKVQRRTKTQYQSYTLNKEQPSWNTIIYHVPNNIPQSKTITLTPASSVSSITTDTYLIKKKNQNKVYNFLKQI